MTVSVKTKLLATTMIMLSCLPGKAQANPELDTSMMNKNTGVAGVFQNGTNTDVLQNAARAKLYWKSLDTAANESLNFIQPTSQSVIVNHVTNGQVTNFLGKMNANGKVVVVNEAGVFFANGSAVNVGALIATTAKTYDVRSDGLYSATGISDKAVTIDGQVNAKEGYVMAIAKQVNVGETANITADKGAIHLDAGSKTYVVDMRGDGKISYSAAKLDQSGIDVKGTLAANAGEILIQARANDIASANINLDGVVDVSSFKQVPPTLDGMAFLDVPMPGNRDVGNITITSTGDINAKGTFDASGSNLAKKDTGNITITAGRDASLDARVVVDASDKSTLKVTAGRDAFVNGEIDNTVNYGSGTKSGEILVEAKRNASLDGYYASGNGKITVNAGADANVNGVYDVATANGSGAIKITSKGDANIDSAFVVGDGSLTVASGGDTTINGTVDAAGKSGLIIRHNNYGVEHTNRGVDGGTINLKAGGDLKGSSNLIASSSTGDAGSITLASGKDMNLTGNVDASATGNTFVVKKVTESYQESNGRYTITKTRVKTVHDGSDAGTVTATAGNDMFIKSVDTSSNFTGGAVKLAAKGNLETGGISTYGAKAGDVTLTTTKGDIIVSDVNAVGYNFGGVESTQFGAEGGNFTATSGGKVTLNSADVRGIGNVGVSKVGSIKVAAKDDVTVNGALSADGFQTAAGDIAISGKNVTLKDGASAFSEQHDGGDIKITATETAKVDGAITTKSSAETAKKGGNVTITAGDNVIINSQVDTSSGNGSAGNITINAKDGYVSSQDSRYLAYGNKAGGAVSITGSGNRPSRERTDASEIFQSIFNKNAKGKAASVKIKL